MYRPAKPDDGQWENKQEHYAWRSYQREGCGSVLGNTVLQEQHLGFGLNDQFHYSHIFPFHQFENRCLERELRITDLRKTSEGSLSTSPEQTLVTENCFVILLEPLRHFQARETLSECQKKGRSCRARVTQDQLAPFRSVVFYFGSQSCSAEV